MKKKYFFVTKFSIKWVFAPHYTNIVHTLTYTHTYTDYDLCRGQLSWVLTADRRRLRIIMCTDFGGARIGWLNYVCLHSARFYTHTHTHILHVYVYLYTECVCAFDSRLVGIYFRLNNGAIVCEPSPLLWVPQDTPLKRHTYPPTPAAIRPRWLNTHTHALARVTWNENVVDVHTRWRTSLVALATTAAAAAVLCCTHIYI